MKNSQAYKLLVKLLFEIISLNVSQTVQLKAINNRRLSDHVSSAVLMYLKKYFLVNVGP